MALPPQYLDVVVSAVRETDPFSFSVQVLDDKSTASLEKLMSDFSLHHRSPANAAPAGFSPKTGDIVSAKFTEDDRWYRARVKRSSAVKREAQVYFIDYGNEETVPFSRLRPLDAKFKALPGQAQEARLSFVKILPRSNEYGGEAWRFFSEIAVGRKLVANIDQREGNLLHLRLIDPSDPNAASDPLACINADLVREGGSQGIEDVLTHQASAPLTSRSATSARTRRLWPRSTRVSWGACGRANSQPPRAPRRTASASLSLET